MILQVQFELQFHLYQLMVFVWSVQRVSKKSHGKVAQRPSAGVGEGTMWLQLELGSGTRKQGRREGSIPRPQQGVQQMI